MTTIDPTARVEKGAQIGRNVTIGPYCIIGGKVTIGDDCQLLTHVHVAARTSIGPRTKISAFASLGTPPQSVHYHGEDTTLEIGADCDIREHVTMNIGTPGEHGGATKVGEKCFLMAGSHVGHDSKVGNNVVFANNATLGGFCEVGDNVFLGGLCAVHQFTRVGEQAMIGGLAGVTLDVIPFTIVIGHRGALAGLNRVGLKRRGFSPTQIQNIYRAYRGIFFGPGHLKDRVAVVAETYAADPNVMRIVDFIRTARSRHVMSPRRAGGSSDD
jgi:UDP-N-acetylglucosamine acyltransferase